MHAGQQHDTGVADLSHMYVRGEFKHARSFFRSYGLRSNLVGFQDSIFVLKVEGNFCVFLLSSL